MVAITDNQNSLQEVFETIKSSSLTRLDTLKVGSIDGDDDSFGDSSREEFMDMLK